MPTVDIEIVWLKLYFFGRLFTFKEVAVDDLYQVGAEGVQRRRETVRVHLPSLAVGVIEHLTGLSQLLQLIWSSISKIYVSDKNVSIGWRI